MGQRAEGVAGVLVDRIRECRNRERAYRESGRRDLANIWAVRRAECMTIADRLGLGDLFTGGAK